MWAMAKLEMAGTRKVKVVGEEPLTEYKSEAKHWVDEQRERAGDEERVGGWMADCHAVASEKGRAGIVMPMCLDSEWGLDCV